MLMKNGYAVYTARNGEEALAALEYARPDLVVTDCQMPGMDGFELLRRIKRSDEFFRLPVLMVTAYTSKEEAVRSLLEGANDYIGKPFDESEVVARINAHLRSHRLVKELENEKKRLAAALHEVEVSRNELERLAVIDVLTGLANRRRLDQYLAAEWHRARRERTPLAVAMFDVDHFKLFNDGYGHLKGDECLQKAGAALREALRRKTDLAARYGGEEFCVVMPLTNEEGALIVAEEIRAAIEAMAHPHEYAPGTGVVTVSAGVAAVVPDADGTLEKLMAQADAALYASKRGGRNRVTAASTLAAAEA